MNSQQINDPLIGRVIAGKIRIEQHLGSGSAGSVYRAHHLALAKPVAIKVLHATHTVDQELVRRFKSEARAASRLDHPNSVRILDFGEENDRLLYIAMEYLDGDDLQTVLEGNPRFDSKRIASIMSQVCGALAAAHDHGVIHRDMKPGNIMLVWDPDDAAKREVVKVCDFGLAKVLDVSLEEMTGGPLTKQGMILGTPNYMSPEQASGDVLDHRSDIYSCGVIMYRMATGHPPFTAENATGMLIKQIMERPTPVLKRNPACDPRIAAIVERAMQKRRDARYQSMREMLDDLRAVLVDSTVLPPPVAAFREPVIADQLSEPEVVVDDTIIQPGSVSHPPPSVTRRSSGPIAITMIGSLALVAVSGLATFLYLDSQNQNRVLTTPSGSMAPPPAPPPRMDSPERTGSPGETPPVLKSLVESGPTSEVETASAAIETTIEPNFETNIEKAFERIEPQPEERKKTNPTTETSPQPVEPPPPPAVEPPPPPPVEIPPPPPVEAPPTEQPPTSVEPPPEVPLPAEPKLGSDFRPNGKIEVSATVGGQDCIEQLDSAQSHLPSADTGDMPIALIAFSERYSTE